ncbi:MAG: tetratricopeptide repeat protein [Spirochaetales bacterium]|jgi:tetratricopeptide (TPR) repeat protein|nr:tetratricopeptide repeat protein [Spirochaetales bacterium]
MKIKIIFCFLVFLCAGLFAQERPDALVLYRQKNYGRAVEVCLDELKEMPRNMNSYVVLGWSLLRMGRNEEALVYGNRGLGVSRYDHRMIQIVGEANYNLGNNLEALKYFEEYVSIAPTGDAIGEIYYFMGEIFIRLGEWNNADIAISTAVHYNPNIAVRWARLGYTREQAKDYRYSLEAYNKALQLNSNLNDALRGRGRVQEILNPGAAASEPESG